MAPRACTSATVKPSAPPTLAGIMTTPATADSARREHAVLVLWQQALLRTRAATP